MPQSKWVGPFALEVFKKRRRQLLKRLAQTEKDFVCLFWSGSEKVRNHDCHFPFRANSNFLYLTGFSEPDSLLLLKKDGNKMESWMGVRPRDLSRNRGSEVWEGERVGVERAPKALGVDRAFDVSQSSENLKMLLRNHSCVFWRFGEDACWDQRLIELVSKLRSERASKRYCYQWRDPLPALFDMRQKKSKEEIEWMRKSARIASQGHIRAMRTVPLAHYEYQVSAEAEREFQRLGAQSVAYSSICASGSNACILHYSTNRDSIAKGSLILMDAGAELDGYASDITRTFPSNGKFSKSQREVYQWVLKAQEAAIQAVRPGVAWNTPHQKAVEVIAEALRALKVLNQSHRKIIEGELWRSYMPHGTSHWIGLDVHDCGDYKDKAGNPKKLEPGYALTIEPGLYFRKEDSKLPAGLRGIGVRIEDDVLVTRNGHEVLSKDCPKNIEEIESLQSPRL